MKKLFLRGIKEKKLKEEMAASPIIETDPDEEFSLDYYDNTPINVSDTKDLNSYSILPKAVVSIKEARTAIEYKKPFIVSKAGNKFSEIEDKDTIYKSSNKMKISSNVQRLGFVIADKRFKEVKIKDKNKSKYKGTINDAYIIYKRKPLNYKKVGYLPLVGNNSTKDYYVEVVTNRGYSWIRNICLLLIMVVLFINTKDWTGWHFNKDDLTVYKTEEVTEYNVDILGVNLNTTPVLEDGAININLSSEYTEGIKYKIHLYDESQDLLYTNEIESGSSLDRMELLKELEQGEYRCSLMCEAYKGNKHIDTLESEVIIKVE